MSSTSPGSNFLGKQNFPGCEEVSPNLAGNLAPGFNGTRQLSGFPAKDGMSSRDSGYSVSTSDGASTCSSSTTDPAEGDGGTLLVLEPKSLRSFTTNDEYLYAMKEDLADWFSCLYKLDVTAENFLSILETGVLLCQHANKVQDFSRQRREQGDFLEMRSYFIRNVPEGNVPYKANVKPETFQARDNVSNFISWGRQLGIPEVLSFETDDLVLRKNEKSVILCLLEIARVGAKLGMLAPTLVQMEEEIDAELAGEEIQPQVQIKTCDMRSLDEMVRDLVGRCTCPVQFPMVKVGDGKYKIGDSRSLIFVRILRNHVMVRVGGGWDTLENYLNKHDPCQCNYRGHRAASVAHKVAVNQQRRSSTPGTSISSPRNATPTSTASVTSPRRMSTSAAHRNRSTSPRGPGRSKSPTLIISRHPTVTEAVNIPGSSGDRQSTVSGGVVSQSWSPCLNSNNSAQISGQPNRSKSPSPGRLRSPSPLTTTSNAATKTLPRPPVSRAASSSALLKGKGQGSDVKGGPPRTAKRAMVSRYPEEEAEDEYDYNGCIVASDTTFLHQDDRMYVKYDDEAEEEDDDDGADDGVASDLEEEGEEEDGEAYEEYTIPGSVSFDERAEPANGIDHDDGGQGEGRKANMSMDKISTMTLSEFKSLLTSALSVPEDVTPVSHSHTTQAKCQSGVTSTASTPGALDADRQLNWGSLREKAKSVRDSISQSVSVRRPASGNNSPAIGRRSLPQSPDVEPSENWPRTPQAVRRHSNANSSSSSAAATAVARPKTPSSLSRPKTPTAVPRPKTPSGIPSFRSAGNDQRGGQKEEYKMARPKTPSQMKREAVAKVAGAISNWVESRSEMDLSTTSSNLQSKTSTRLVGASMSIDENDVDGEEVAMALANPQLEVISSSVRERPGTPSRIPKPCFTPRPVTPKTTGKDIMSASNQERSKSSSPPVPPQTLSLSQNLTDSFSISTGSSSGSSMRAKTVISRVVNSTTNSPVSNQPVRAAVGRSQPQTPSSNISGSKSYKDMYTARRCKTPGPYSGSGPRSQPSRCVTPGPRENWSLGENAKENSHNNKTLSGNSKTSSQRRSSISNVSQGSHGNSSSNSNLHSDNIMVTNEITFSDDEEINELVKNTAMLQEKSKVKPTPRSASVDARRLIRQNASCEQEVLVISRNGEGKHGVQVMRKGNSSVIKRPPSRGSSTDRTSNMSQTPGKFRSQTPDPSMFRRKLSNARSTGSNGTTDSAPAIPKSKDKSFNRTEAWVDSTLSDTKRKLPPRPKRSKTLTNDIPVSELEPRPLNEIKAILSEPNNQTMSLLDTESLDAPPEDAEMFKKMEKLFEKYREMELRASVNETPGGGLGTQTENAAVDTAKAPSHRSLNASSRSAPSVASLKTSSGSMGSSSSGRSSNPSAVGTRTHSAKTSIRSSISEEYRVKRSTSSPGSFQKSPSSSPAILSPAQESNVFPGTNHSNSSNGDLSGNGKIGRGHTISESNPSASSSGVVSSLRDIDSEVAKDPAALISKIKEILRVRPRKDDNSKVPTKIPAPRGLSKTKRSKSVSNLFQVEGMCCDLTLAPPRGIDDSGLDHRNGVVGPKLTRTNSGSNSNIAYSEYVYRDDCENGDVLTELSRKSSIQSDSGDSVNRCETPVPKLATPLTTGRSTFINRKGGSERAGGRGLSQDKENALSSSQTSLSSRSMLSTTEDEADYV